MNDPWFIFLIAIAGGLGAVVRYLVHAGFLAPRPRAPQPTWLGPFAPPPPRPIRARRIWADPDWRLVAVNAAASLLAGFATAAVGGPWGVVLVTGFCGGLSTWSTLINDARVHLVRGRLGRAATVIVLTLACSISAAWLGYGLAWLLARIGA